ncbi:MAG: hypothetical protein SXU28_00035 [Pseudomonadota bacterium]|nr:hypothetical protein [Pseudomonadota bacterium]
MMMTIALLLGTVADGDAMASSRVEMADTQSVLGGNEYTVLPEKWELSYDIAMLPYMDDYKRCLGYTDLQFEGERDSQPVFERQYRMDLPRCAGVRAEAISQSNAALGRRGRSEIFTPADVSEAFDTLGYIHIQRGRNLDAQLKLYARAFEEKKRAYQAQIRARDEARPADPFMNRENPDADN